MAEQDTPSTLPINEPSIADTAKLESITGSAGGETHSATASSLPGEGASNPDALAISTESLSPESLALNTETPVNETISLAGVDVTAMHQLLDAGGPVMAILMVMSVVVLAVFLLKCWQFARLGIGRLQVVEDVLQHRFSRTTDASLKQLAKTANPIARVLEVALPLKAQAQNSTELVREEILRVAMQQLARLRSQLRVLEVIATLSPLLGLLGTVLGMIEAFQKLQGAGAAVDPAILSGGIWEALLTTAAGLIVAIPAVIALNWLEKRVDTFKLALEDVMTRLFTADLQTAQASIPTSSPAPHKGKRVPSSTQTDGDFALAT